MDNNGFFFNSTFFPREIVANILSFVSPHLLLRDCSLVCKNWYDIITSRDIWKIKIQRIKTKSLSKLSIVEQMRLNYPWYVFSLICCYDPFEKNLLRNNCGQNNFEHWDVDSPSLYRNVEWLVEKSPAGAHSLPACEEIGDNTSCFATTYLLCEKCQIIDLITLGCLRLVLDQMKPKIIVSEWYAGRFDCGCKYILTISLLDEDYNLIYQKEEKRLIEQWAGQPWEKITIEIENYGSGVRFIKFSHAGSDTQYWAGHYGSKMAGGVVKISLPKYLDYQTE